jgi:starvation-inducible outer membrane lipoprotein
MRHAPWLLLLFPLLSGCVSIPPLIQVEHNHEQQSDTSRRLDAIEQRLERIDQKLK